MAQTISLIKSNKTLKLLSKLVKKDGANTEGCLLVQRLQHNDFVVYLKNELNEICSFIWFGIYKNDICKNINQNAEKNAKEKVDKNIDENVYIHINYSYTFKKYRNMGMNKKLRLWIESYCVENSIQYVVSVPLSDSNSSIVLSKLAYIKIDNYYLKKIF